jgi:hypothetical protein
LFDRLAYPRQQFLQRVVVGFDDFEYHAVGRFGLRQQLLEIVIRLRRKRNSEQSRQPGENENPQQAAQLDWRQARALRAPHRYDCQ